MKRRKQSLKDYTADKLLEYAMTLLYNRWRLLAPPPFEPDYVYDYLLSDEQHQAISYLDKTMPTCLLKRRRVHVEIDIDISVGPNAVVGVTSKYKAKILDLVFPEFRVAPETFRYAPRAAYKFYVSNLPPHIQDTIREWGCRWMVLSLETDQVLHKLKRLSEVCTTMGHIKRVWPQVTSLLPDLAQQKLAKLQRQAPYPDGVLLPKAAFPPGSSRANRLREEWTPEALQWYDDRLTEALCLPMMHTSQQATKDEWPMSISDMMKY